MSETMEEMSRRMSPGPPSRRTVIAGGGALLLARCDAAFADPAEMEAAIRDAVGDGAIPEGRIEVDIPPLVENGNSVPLTLIVQSPMTPADHVKAIYIFSPENPLPNISRFRIGPRCGKAEIKTTIRLATTQTVHVVAVMNDGSRWLGKTEVEVTTAACFDPT